MKLMLNTIIIIIFSLSSNAKELAKEQKQAPRRLLISAADLTGLLNEYKSANSDEKIWYEKQNKIYAQLSKFDLTGIDTPQITFEYVLKAFDNNGYIGSTQLPNLRNLASDQIWIDFFAKKIGSQFNCKDTPVLSCQKRMFALNTLMTGFTYDYASKSKPTDELSVKLQNLYFENCANYPNVKVSSYTYDCSKLIQYGSWLGDLRIMNLAKMNIEKFLKGEMKDNSAFQSSLFALDSFKGTNPKINKENKDFIIQAINNPKTPDYIKKKFASLIDKKTVPATANAAKK